MYNFQEEFYQAMSRLRANSRSRAASTTERLEPMITEIDRDGKIVSRPLEESKAASVGVVPAQVNKAKEIAEFISRRV
jgi:hypothetical protein